MVKVYGAFYPADENCREAVAQAGEEAMGHEEPWLFMEGDMLRFSFEGLYFPLEEIVEALKKELGREAEGKLDYLDLEDWRLVRHVLLPGRDFTFFCRSLNHVLEYSGQ